MKLSNLVYAAAGYTLGARAGRERYETIVRLARRFAGSQTIQSTAGVVQAQFDQLTYQAKQTVAARLGGPATTPRPGANWGAAKNPTARHNGSSNGANGYHPN